jgi:transcriptional regulator with XRE-family HTH domain
MPTMTIKEHLVPTGALLLDAIKAAGMTAHGLATALGIAGNTVTNRVTGRSAVNTQAAKDIARILKCDWKPLVSPPNPHPKGTPEQVKARLANAAKARAAQAAQRAGGPAARALALHEAARPVQPAREALNGAPVPVLGLELLSDGTTTVRLHATLPGDRGAVLFRQLLDFGLTTKGR